jgi:hypothetical protein
MYLRKFTGPNLVTHYLSVSIHPKYSVQAI